MAARSESEVERKETKQKVDDDRKHVYPLQVAILCHLGVVPVIRTVGSEGQ